MRDTFHTELQKLADDLAATARVAGQMMATATESLRNADLGLAEQVIARDDEINKLVDDMELRSVNLLVLEAPVAADLRTVVAAMNSVVDLKRMGDLAQHIAKITRLKHPHNAVPDDVAMVFARMGLLAAQLADLAAETVEQRDPMGAARLMAADDEVDALRRQLFHTLFEENWPHGVEPAVDAALLARYYERFSDHAVAIARQVSYLVTGELPLESKA